MFSTIDQQRQTCRFPACRENSLLTKAAVDHAQYMSASGVISDTESAAGTGFSGVTYADAERVFNQLAAQGHQLNFDRIFSHTQPLLRVASQWPDTRFESCSGLQTRANVGTFEARYYEGT